MKILLAVDGSSFTKRMLAYLTTHEEWLVSGHAFTLLTAVPSVPPRAAAVMDKAVVKSYYQDEAEKVFKTIRTFFSKRRIESTYVFKVGPAAEIIANMADQGEYDLVMMGSHGHGTLGNLLLGSVVSKVLAHTHTPVLVIR
jgi:nucleotide-binding universal stress UspA family protein